MPKRCIVGGCSNTHQDGVSLFVFPKDANLRKIWTAKVRLTRGEWKGPSDSSVVCSAHFDEEDFDVGHYASFEMKRTRRLRPESVPRIVSSSSTDIKRRASDSVRIISEKRRRTRDVDEMIASYVQEQSDVSSVSSDEGSASGTTPEAVEGPSQVFTEPPASTHDQVDESDMDVEEMEDPAMDMELQTPVVQVDHHGQKRSVGTQVFLRVPSRVKRIQKSMKTADKGCLVRPEPPVVTTSSRGTTYSLDDIGEIKEEEDVEEESDSSPESDNKQPSSPGYQPSSSPSSPSSSSSERNQKKSQKRLSKRKRRPSPNVPWERPSRSLLPHQARKYIVFEESLMDLLQICPSCNSSNVALSKREVGTLLVVTRECLSCNAAATKWESQPWIGNTPAGNILLSAAILFAGGSPRETLRIMEHTSIAAHSERTFHRHQKEILAPAISHQWKLCQDRTLMDLAEKGVPLTIGGDGRADSPGHSAKYGVYTALELNINKIVDFQLVQSNEVKSSYHMELEGFKRVQTFLTEDKGLVISKVVTDRHRQLAKHIRETSPDIVHVFDVWHIAKAIRKKVHALAKQKDCECLLEWEQSINNHVYWVAASSGEDEPELRVAKWKSLMNHIQNIHEGHSELFPRCVHGDLESQGRSKKWLKPGTKVCEKLDDILTATMLVNDMKKLSAGKQTSSLEAYHSKINHYAPKLKAYSYEGMTCRLQLAAMDFNENSNRKQATTAKGELCYKVSKPKYKPGKATVTIVKEAKTFSFVDDLMTDIAKHSKEFRNQSQERKAAPPSLTSQYEYPTKEELVQRHRSRFNQK